LHFYLLVLTPLGAQCFRVPKTCSGVALMVSLVNHNHDHLRPAMLPASSGPVAPA